MHMMEITTNKDINNETLQIIKESFEEQKDIRVIHIYVDKGTVYGIYINNPYASLSFIHEPLTNMSTDIDGHNIFMFELGLLLHLIYRNGSTQMFNILHSCGDNGSWSLSNNNVSELLQLSYDNPPLQLSSFHLIKWIDRLNDGDLNMSIIDLIGMVENFMIIHPLDVDVSNKNSEALMKNNLNMVRQELKGQSFKKITEATLNKIDKLFIQLQIDLYITDNK